MLENLAVPIAPPRPVRNQVSVDKPERPDGAVYRRPDSRTPPHERRR